MPVQPIPDGYHTVTPYLLVADAAQLIDFLVRGFGATLVERLDGPNGRVRHAQVKIGDSFVMMGEPQPPDAPVASTFYLYVLDTDALYRRAMAAGGESLMEPSNQFYGDRTAAVKDPFGNRWWIATHVEDVSLEEIARRAAAQGKK